MPNKLSPGAKWRAAVAATMTAAILCAGPFFAAAETRGGGVAARESKTFVTRSPEEAIGALQAATSPGVTRDETTIVCTPASSPTCFDDFASTCADLENCTGSSGPDGVTCTCTSSGRSRN